MIVARFETNFCTKLVVSRTERSFFIVVGVFKSTIAFDLHQRGYRQRTKHAQDSKLPSVSNGFWMALMSSLLLEVLKTYPLMI